MAEVPAQEQPVAEIPLIDPSKSYFLVLSLQCVPQQSHTVSMSTESR